MILDIFDSISSWFQETGEDWEMVSVILLISLSALGAIWRLGLWFFKRRRAIEAEKDLHPFFSPIEIKKATQYYISTKFQSNPPSHFNELKESNRIVAREKLIPFFLNKSFKPGKDDQRFYMILAGSGMGKTTFMLNLYLSYLRMKQMGRAKYKIKLLPLGYPDLLQHIDTIEDKEHTILLLDGLDEDNQAVRKYKRRLDRIINKVQHFRVVVFTCRTQFFPSEEEEPLETGIRLYGSRQSYLTFAKMYLSPFDEKDIQAYLRKRFGRFQKKKKERSWQIISQSPSLMVRPMILSYIEDLLEEDVSYEYVTNLYRTVIQKWIEREGGRVLADQRESFQRELYRFSREIALNIYANRKNRNGLFISEKEINGFADRHEIELGEMEMKSRSLLNRNMAGQYKFAHKSILEYFLAVECIDNPKFADRIDFDGLDVAKLFYRELILLNHTLSFLTQLGGRVWCRLGNGEKRAPSALAPQELKKITEMGLESIEDLTPISPLVELRGLYLNGTAVKDLQPISDFHQLRSLHLGQTNISSLNPLQQMDWMEELDLSACPVRNLQPTKQMERLKKLCICQTEVESLAQLGGHGALQELDISRTRVKDLDPLKKLKELKVLKLDHTSVSSLNPLRELKKLSRLSFAHCKVRNLSPMKGMQQLRKLNIAHNPISNVKLLKELKKLEELKVSEDQLGESGKAELEKLLPNCRILLV